MEKIQIGEYVRTDKGNIGRVIEKRLAEYISAKTIITKYTLDTGEWTTDLYIKKHSKELIGLIQVGDYVNGSKVVDIAEDMQTGEVHLEMTYNYTNNEKGDCTIYNKDIKTIVTKEQFKSMQYKVEEDRE